MLWNKSPQNFLAWTNNHFVISHDSGAFLDSFGRFCFLWCRQGLQLSGDSTGMCEMAHSCGCHCVFSVWLWCLMEKQLGSWRGSRAASSLKAWALKSYHIIPPTWVKALIGPAQVQGGGKRTWKYLVAIFGDYLHSTVYYQNNNCIFEYEQRWRNCICKTSNNRNLKCLILDYEMNVLYANQLGEIWCSARNSVSLKVSHPTSDCVSQGVNKLWFLIILMLSKYTSRK